MTLGVRGVVENERGEVLMVRHTYVDGWFLPGGGVERGEPAEEALARELVEEAGVQLEGPATLVGIYSNHRHFPNDHVLVYRATAWREVPASSVGEIAEVRWVDPLNPPEGATPGNARRLREIFAGSDASLYW